MGGSAFQSLLGAEAFPRVPPAVYSSLKARLLPILSELYSYVAIPVEAPEKNDYGDLDFLVAGPRPCPDTRAPRDAISHTAMQQALGAKHVLPMDGNRTSNYAVPVKMGEWKGQGHSQEEETFRSVAPNSEIFYQVDIHVCHDEADLARISFFHSYGDMGMMLGLIARNCGLRLGEHGLKIPTPGLPPFLLSESFDEILPFLGLSREAYDLGFATKMDVFRWVASMRFFEPRFFRTSGPGITKVKQDRKMYAEFVLWVEKEYLSGDPQSPRSSIDNLNTRTRDEALVYFKKATEYQALTHARSGRERLRKVFCGHNIRDWTDLGEYWKGVKMIMDEMRKEMGGDAGVSEFVEEHGEEELRATAIQVRDQLGLSPASHH